MQKDRESYMNLENYVCTLEQAKKLDKLLGKRESIFCWQKYRYEKEIRIAYGNPFKYRKSLADLEIFYNAYTSQELWGMISEIVEEEDVGGWQEEWYSAGEFKFYTSLPMVGCEKTPYLFLKDRTETQARAEFLIYLLENINV